MITFLTHPLRRRVAARFFVLLSVFPLPFSVSPAPAADISLGTLVTESPPPSTDIVLGGADTDYRVTVYSNGTEIATAPLDIAGTALTGCVLTNGRIRVTLTAGSGGTGTGGVSQVYGDGTWTTNTGPDTIILTTAATQALGKAQTALQPGEETDPIWSAVSNTISTQAANGNTAHGWGDHATSGYLTTLAHSNATGLGIMQSGHTGTASRVWGTDSTGAACERSVSTGLTMTASSIALSADNVTKLAASYTSATGTLHCFDRYIEGRYWSTQAVCIGTAPSWGTFWKVLKVHATTLGASTPTIAYNLQERPWGTFASSGSNLYSTVAIADADGDEKTSFNDSTLAPRAGVFFTTPTGSETGNVLGLVLHMEIQRN